MYISESQAWDCFLQCRQCLSRITANWWILLKLQEKKCRTCDGENPSAWNTPLKGRASSTKGGDRLRSNSWLKCMSCFQGMGIEKLLSLTSLTDMQNLGFWSALGGCADTDLPEDKWPGSPALLGFLCNIRGTGPWWSLTHSWCFESPYPAGMGSTELARSPAAVISHFKNPVVVVYIPHFQRFGQGANLFYFILKTSVLFLLFLRIYSC